MSAWAGLWVGLVMVGVWIIVMTVTFAILEIMRRKR